jgi:stress response protein YsnF
MGAEESSSNNYNTYNKAIDQQNTEELKQIIKSSDFSEQRGEQQIKQHQQIVPVLKEEYSISKETTTKEANIEKRLVTKTKTLKVPITYEELYINGKKLKSVEDSQILSALKDKINSIANIDNDTSVEQSVKKKEKIENRGEIVPLMYSSTDEQKNKEGDNTQTQIGKEKQKIIPLYEEHFEIVKKMVKVAEIVIAKRKVTEKRKIDIDIRGEEVTIKYPDGRSDKLS